MNATSAPSQFEMGLSSMVDILFNISSDTERGVSFMKKIHNEFADINSYTKSVENSFKSVTKTIINFQKFQWLESIETNNILRDTLSSVRQILNKRDNIILPKQTETQKITEVTQPNIAQNITVDTSKTEGYLASIDNSVTKILTKLLGKENSKESESKESTKSGLGNFGITEFASAIVLLKKNLTSALIKNFSKFFEAYNTVMDKLNVSKSEKFAENLESLGITLDKLVQKIKEPTKFLGYLAVSLILLQLAVLSPTFFLMMSAIGAFVVVLSKYTSDKAFNSGLKDFAMGLGILALSAIVLQYVSWESLAKLVVFIGGLNLAMRSMNGPGGMSGKLSESPMLHLAIGIAALSISALMMTIVPWESLGKLIVFIIGLNLALRSFAGPKGMGTSLKSSPMILFATGIAILTLTMFAMAELPWSGIFKMLIFVGGLGLVMKLFNFNKMGPANGMIQFAFGIGILVLAMYAIEELQWESIAKMIVFIGALGLTIRLMNGRGVPPLLSFAFGLGIMVLAMYAMDELPWSALGKTLLFIGGLGLVLKLFTSGPMVALTMIGIAAGLFVMFKAFEVFKKSGFDLKDTLAMTLAIGGIAAVMAVIGIPAVAALVGLGALATVGMAISLVAIAYSMQQISGLDINLDNIISFFSGVALLSFGFAATAIFMIPGALGAVLFLPIATAAILGAAGLSLISALEIDNQKIDNFMSGVSSLATGFSSNVLSITFGAAAALLFLPIAVSSLLAAGVLALISNVSIDDKKLDIFNSSVVKLANNMDQFGLISLGKGALKAGLLLPIFGAGLLAALLLQKISSVAISKERVGIFGEMMNFMVDTILTSLANNEDKMEKAQPGLNALAKLLSVTKGLAESVQMMANLKFYDYEVRNGKLVMTGVRQLTDKDFKMVGVNLGLMLDALIKPLEILGGNSDSFVLGGKVIANPFKNNNTLKGIDIIAKMGSAYKPLAESIKLLAEAGVMTDPTKTKQFTDSLIYITATYQWVFEKFQKFDADSMVNSLSTVTKFNTLLKDTPVDKIANLNGIFEKFVTNLTDDIKWKKIKANITFMRQEFAAISKSINGINIEKATAFERNIKALIDKNNGEGLKEAAESLKQLLGLVNENVQQTGNTGFGTGYSAPTNPFAINPTPQPVVQTKQNKNTPENTNDAELINLINTALTNMTGILEAINTKLGGKLKVINFNSNTNGI